MLARPPAAGGATAGLQLQPSALGPQPQPQSHSSSLGALGYEAQPWSHWPMAVVPGLEPSATSHSPGATAPGLWLQAWSPRVRATALEPLLKCINDFEGNLQVLHQSRCKVGRCANSGDAPRALEPLPQPSAQSQPSAPALEPWSPAVAPAAAGGIANIIKHSVSYS